MLRTPMLSLVTMFSCLIAAEAAHPPGEWIKATSERHSLGVIDVSGELNEILNAHGSIRLAVADEGETKYKVFSLSKGIDSLYYSDKHNEVDVGLAGLTGTLTFRWGERSFRGWEATPDQIKAMHKVFAHFENLMK